MFMKRTKLSLLLLTAALVTVTTLPVKCQEPDSSAATTQLSLETLVAEALLKNPELKFYEAEITAAKAGRKIAGRPANPEISGGMGQKRVNSPGLSDEGIAWSVSVQQPFEWPGRLALRKAIANCDMELAELGPRRDRSRE